MIQDESSVVSTPELSPEIVELSPEQAAQVPAGMSAPAGPSKFDQFFDEVIRLWDYQLIEFNDTPITVKKIIIAILVLIIGYILSKLISKRVGSTILPRLHVEAGPASAIQTILYYVMLLIATVLSLQIAGVPLTVFTIFGGALAIGIGFGSQNIVNNFISGLIMLIERPIQVGDFVTVGDNTGRVLKIGPRATHVQCYNGVTTIVPNSHLLENEVKNWNLPDRKIRSIIAVGVAYGTDVQHVKSTLEQLLTDHIRVLESVDNRVLFAGFGDSSLDFEVHFWMSPRSAFDRRQIESDLRFKIDALFRENDITIPFPQRDVNFKAIETIQIKEEKDS